MRIGSTSFIVGCFVALLLTACMSTAKEWLVETVATTLSNYNTGTSIVLDSSGIPHIAYYDSAVSDLKYAWKNGGQWSVETIVDGFASEFPYHPPSLAVNAADSPFIAYTNSDGNIEIISKSDDSWSTQPVYEDGRSPRLDIDDNSTMRIVFQSGIDIWYGFNPGSGWLFERVETAAGYQRGKELSLATDSAGRPHVSYQGRTSNHWSRIRYATRIAGVWQVDTLSTPARWTSIAVDESDIPHITSISGYDMYYATKEGGTWSTEIPDVHTSYWCPIKIGSLGQPCIGYSYHKLRYAFKEPGSWQIYQADDLDPTCLNVSMDLDEDDRPHYAYQGDNHILKYATFLQVPSNVDGAGVLPPVSGEILRCAPNPFNPQTTISYELPNQTSVNLRIFDLAGRLVDVLVDGEMMSAGTHTAMWNGRDAHDRSMPSGTYFYRLESDGFVETRRMTLIR